MRKLLKRLDEYASAHGLTTAAVLFFTGAVALAVIGHLRQYGSIDPGQLLTDFYANLSSEMVSIATTVLILDWLARKREARREEERLKEDLIGRMSSRVNTIALRAAEELMQHGWLADGTLLGADLYGANLQNAALPHACLQDAVLIAANLQYAVLRKAVLLDANLEDADLESADFEAAMLAGVNFKGADMRYARFAEAVFARNTLLPDGTPWQHGVDLARFTDPEHLNFWRSDNQRSPAYREELPPVEEEITPIGRLAEWFDNLLSLPRRLQQRLAGERPGWLRPASWPPVRMLARLLNRGGEAGDASTGEADAPPNVERIRQFARRFVHRHESAAAPVPPPDETA